MNTIQPPTQAQVEALADAASEADCGRYFGARPEWAERIRHAVDLLHAVAQAAAAEYGYRVYDDSEEADDVA